MEKTETTKRSNKRQRILQAASDCFARYGYEKTTLEDIGKRLQLNKASLYYYFKNKEEIFVQVILQETEAFISELQQEALDQESLVDQVRFYLTERIRRYEEVLNLTQLSIDSLQKVEPLFQKLYKTIKEAEIRFLEHILEAGQVSDNWRPFDPKDLARSLFIVSDALKHDQIIQRELHFDNGFHYEEVEQRMESIIQYIFVGLQK
ncbi:MAG: TetR/AcrR family transcriptional regulator [Bacteroidota bacterium]